MRRTIVRGKPTVRKVWNEVVARAYRNPGLRKILGAPFRTTEPSAWAFILGCYNSGTTLLWQCLAAHPNAAALPREASWYSDLFVEPDRFGRERSWVGLEKQLQPPMRPGPEAKRQILRDFAPWIKGSKRSMFVEKTVSNLTRTAWLAQQFPEAKFIGTERNGFYVCEGIRRKGKVGPPLEAQARAPSWEEAAAQWNSAVALLEEARRNLPTFHMVRYEELVSQPLPVLSRAFEFLELEVPPMKFEGGILRVHQTRIPLASGNPASLARLGATDLDHLQARIRTSLRSTGYPLVPEAEK